MIDSRRYLIESMEPVDLDDDALRAVVALAKAGDADAANTVLAATIRLVHWIAYRYGRDELLDDLIQEGAIGVMCAIDGFDANKACAMTFASYARLWISSRMKKYLNRVPVVWPSICTGIVSLDDDTLDDSGRDLHERVPSATPTPAAICCQLDDRDELQRLLMAISDHEREAITGVMGIGCEKTKSMDVAASQGVSKNAVTNRVKRGVEKMRQIAFAGGGTP